MALFVSPFGSQPFDLFIVAFWGLAALGVIAWRYGWFDALRD